MAPGDPKSEYASRLDTHRQRGDEATRASHAIARARLAIALLAISIAWASLDAHWFGAGWIALPGALFAGLVFWHGRVKDRADRAARMASFYEAGLARIAGEFRGRGPEGRGYLRGGHLYAIDLDLLGDGSLFQLLCLAQTRHGERKLAGWLLDTAGAEEIVERQGAVSELRDRLDLREDLDLAGRQAGGAIDADGLVAWALRPTAGLTLLAPISALAASVLSLSALYLFSLDVIDSLPLLVAIALQGVVWMGWKGRVHEALGGVDRAASDLGHLASVLARVAAEPLSSPRAAALVDRLRSDDGAANAIGNLRRRVELHDAARNLLFAPVAILLLWPIHGAFWIDRWRQRRGPAVEGWLDALGEIEALSSLAANAFENPDAILPEIGAEGSGLHAEGLGHPLLPAGECVRNNVRLDANIGVWVVSGSNMSGKTTLLRAVGTNAVLAMAGGVVRAHRWRMEPFRIGASIRTQDSLLDGRSRFAAEVERLRDVMDRARNEPPLLFLLDEILSGTNSHDRRIGASAVIRGLLDRRAMGLLSTHDLALADIAGEGESRVANVHFADTVENGEMTFDYRLRQGVVDRSNALEIMRAAGLPV